MPLVVALTVTGLHVPVMPFIEVPGKTGAVAFIQTDWLVPKGNAGVTIGFTVTTKVAGVAQGLDDCVNV